MSTAFEAGQKLEYIETLLAKNKLMLPNDVIKAVEKKFGSGVAKNEITRLRWEKFGVRFGPGGIPFGKDGQRLTAKNEIVQPTQAATVQNPDKLTNLVVQLKEEMRTQHITQLVIPTDGPAKAIQTTERILF